MAIDAIRDKMHHPTIPRNLVCVAGLQLRFSEYNRTMVHETINTWFPVMD